MLFWLKRGVYLSHDICKMSEDTKDVIMKPYMEKGQEMQRAKGKKTMIYEALHKKLKIEQHEHRPQETEGKETMIYEELHRQLKIEQDEHRPQ